MRHATWALLMVFAWNALGDDLPQKIEAKRRENAALVATIDQQATPLIITDADTQVEIGGNLFQALFQRFNAFPAARRVDFTLTGGQRPQFREGGGLPFGCGYYAEFTGFSGFASLSPFVTSWSSAGEQITTTLGGGLDAQFAAHINGPACPYVRNCHICGFWICCDIGASCDEHWCGGGFQFFSIHGFARAVADAGGRLSVSSPTSTQRAILLVLAIAPAGSIQELAQRTGLSPAVVSADLDSLRLRGVVAGPPYDLAGEAVSARKDIDSLTLYSVFQNGGTAIFSAGVTIPVPGFGDFPIGLTVPLSYPGTTRFAGGQRLGGDLTNRLVLPPNIITQDDRPVGSRDYFVSISAKDVQMTDWGIEAKGRLRALWDDLRQNEGLLRIHYIDVGEGDAILVQTPRLPDGSGDQTILIDGGPTRDDPNTPEIENRVLLYLRSMGLPEGSTIDYLVLTHPDEDHLTGLLDVLSRYDVKTVIDSGYVGGALHREFIALAKAKSQYVSSPTANAIALTGPVTASILYTYRPAESLGHFSTRRKNASIVLRLVHGSTSYLFTGDIKGLRRDGTATFVERILLRESGSALPSTILKISDHGAGDSSSAEFLRATGAKAAVVSSGLHAPIGFLGLGHNPDARTIRRIGTELPQALVLRTDASDAHSRYWTDANGDDVLAFSDGLHTWIYQAQLLGNQFVFELKATLP